MTSDATPTSTTPVTTGKLELFSGPPRRQQFAVSGAVTSAPIAHNFIGQSHPFLAISLATLIHSSQFYWSTSPFLTISLVNLPRRPRGALQRCRPRTWLRASWPACRKPRPPMLNYDVGFCIFLLLMDKYRGCNNTCMHIISTAFGLMGYSMEII